MAGLVILLFLISLVCLPIALIKPSLFHFIQKGKPSRKKASLTFLGLLILLFILIGLLAPKNAEPVKEENNANIRITTTPSRIHVISTPPNVNPTQRKAIPTLTPTSKPDITTGPKLIPTENCDKYAGTSAIQPCIQRNNAIDRANYPLNATVKDSSQGLVITNNDNVKWTSCDISIGYDKNNNDFYEVGIFSNYATVQPHQTEVIPWGDITKMDGTRFPYNTTQPTDIEITCDVNGQTHNSIFNQ